MKPSSRRKYYDFVCIYYLVLSLNLGNFLGRILAWIFSSVNFLQHKNSALFKMADFCHCWLITTKNSAISVINCSYKRLFTILSRKVVIKLLPFLPGLAKYLSWSKWVPQHYQQPKWRQQSSYSNAAESRREKYVTSQARKAVPVWGWVFFFFF